MAAADTDRRYRKSSQLRERHMRAGEKEPSQASRNFEIKLRAAGLLTHYAGNPRTHSAKQIRKMRKRSRNKAMSPNRRIEQVEAKSKGQTTKKGGETSSRDARAQNTGHPKLVLWPGASVKVVDGQHRIHALEPLRELFASILEHKIAVPIRVPDKGACLSDKKK
jgi:hypothetical protein